MWEAVGDDFDERLVLGSEAAQAVAAYLVGVQIHFRSHQTLRPGWV